MFHFILKFLVIRNPNHSTLRNCRLISTQSASNKIINVPNDKQSPTVSYFINSCGLSLESAISASRLVEIKNKERSDSVLELLRSYGFSQNDISNLILKRPRVILVDPDKNLRQRLEFFESMGIAKSDLPATFISCTRMFGRSLNKGIKPTYDMLKCYVDTDVNVVRTFCVLNHLSRVDLKKRILPNVETLRNHNVPKSQIGKFLFWHPVSVAQKPNMFKEKVEAVSKMGINPESRKFISAVVSMTSLSELLWNKKRDVLFSFGWTERDFDLAFSLQPMLMFNSEKKLRKMMDFLVNRIGLKASDVARCPYVIHTSLEKRVIPRWSLLEILISKGLFKKNSGMIWKFNESKKAFEKSIVNKFKDELSESVKAYESHQ